MKGEIKCDSLCHAEISSKHLNTLYPIPENIIAKAHIKSIAQYNEFWQNSINKPEEFWGKLAKQELDWIKPFEKVLEGEFTNGECRWFSDGLINASYNCLDRHINAGKADKIAIFWEPDDEDIANEHMSKKTYSYNELLQEVSRLSNWLLMDAGMVSGKDVVTIYMPMIPYAVIAMLACARTGLIHNVVFGGFSAESLASRLSDSSSNLIITSDESMRAGKIIHYHQTVLKAINMLQDNQKSSMKILSLKRKSWSPLSTQNDDKIDILPDEHLNFYWWHEVIPHQSNIFKPIPRKGDDPLFMLYTSGSTGKPKGLVHGNAGYLLYALITSKWTFDMHENDRFGCMADIGWITGHTYGVYGPLSLGVSVTIFEGTPFFPDAGRLMRIIDRFKLTHLYTAPTVIRVLQKFADKYFHNSSLESLRVIGCVGEPINPEVINL